MLRIFRLILRGFGVMASIVSNIWVVHLSDTVFCVPPAAISVCMLLVVRWYARWQFDDRL
jgi:hypothetical protein